MAVSWFYVKCAECARRFGVFVAPKLFRAEIVDGRMARVEVRTKGGWSASLIGDGDREVWPVVNCAHNHRFEFSMERGALLDQIGFAIEAARGAEFALIEPTNPARSPGEERAAIRRSRDQTTVRP